MRLMFLEFQMKFDGLAWLSIYIYMYVCIYIYIYIYMTICTYHYINI